MDNGVGKTTTVSILTTTLAPTSGRGQIAGRDPAADQAGVRGKLGIVFQQPSLDLNLTAEENIRAPAPTTPRTQESAQTVQSS